ncbi:uncharacterized protein LOC105683070 isoform X2 [Athalia rosae]|uniref:uncharacterized protein LOC105683070 isoform X2 n=1 Tax=Athalia rosae TaxID=37344 RepID=UPI0020339C21|nr:uncharacterized protein LOC105683070 isoform X2 [Athalia rosae]
MLAKMRMRSVSVENLGDIVKHMIDGVLEDNDQAAKLHQAVLEEYYLTKIKEFKQEKTEVNIDDVEQEVVRRSLSKNTVDQFLSEDKNTKPSKSQVLIFSSDTIAVTKFTKSSQDLESQSIDCKSTTNIPNNISTHKIEDAGPDDLTNAPVVHIVHRPKYPKPLQAGALNNTDVCRSSATSFLKNHSTRINITQVMDESTCRPPTAENIQESPNNVSSNTEKNKCRHSFSEKEASVITSRSEKEREVPIEFRNKGEIAFENWKREKNRYYRHIYREEQKKKRLEQTAKATEIQKKEAATEVFIIRYAELLWKLVLSLKLNFSPREAFLFWRKQQDARQILNNARKRILAQMEAQKLQNNEKRTINSQAFKAWKKQKDIKLRERKMYTIAYDQPIFPKQQVKSHKPKADLNVAFNVWLDQLDCVLHQKYLRERRYLVRSCYCQPAYFGSAVLSGR